MCKWAGIAVVSFFIGSGVASAQTAYADPFSATLAKELSQARWAQPQNAAQVMNGRLKLDQMGDFTLDSEVASRSSSVAVQSSGRERSWGWKVVGGAIGAVGGLFAGGMLGAALEPDCHCDDPGLKGALIGAPIGAVAGAIVGIMLF